MKSVTFETDNAHRFTFFSVGEKEMVRVEGWYGDTCTLPLPEFLKWCRAEKKRRELEIGRAHV